MTLWESRLVCRDDSVGLSGGHSVCRARTMRHMLSGCTPKKAVFPVFHVRARRSHCPPSQQQFPSAAASAPVQRLAPGKRLVRMCATTEVGIQELEGLCMASLQGLGYSRDEASALTEVRVMKPAQVYPHFTALRTDKTSITVSVWWGVRRYVLHRCLPAGGQHTTG